jgi:4'-phosphopantetheinyl transferase
MTEADFTWQPAHPVDITLGMDEVHLWLVDMEVSAALLSKLAAYLSPEESARAARFHFARDRDHFTVAHALLRLLLAAYCRVEPETLRFVLNAYGKPALETGQPRVYFNLSHSHHLALYAFTRVCELGVDIEYMRGDIEYTELAALVFSPRERAALVALPVGLKAAGFFNAWTRKEAYIKARGMGVSLGLDRFDVTLSPDEPAALVETREEGQVASAWSMYALHAPSGYKAALALPAHGVSLRCWRWDQVVV